MERITFNKSVSGAVPRAWATEFNRAYREAPKSASMSRLRFVALFTFAALVFVAGRAFAETNADAPTGKPDAAIDLATKEGVGVVKGQWRYSDTKIIPVNFRAAGLDRQPTGKPIKTYDFTPHAGGVDFDDSKWEVLDPTTLDATLDRAGFVLTGIGSTSRSLRARTMSISLARLLFSRRRSMITPKSGWMAKCRMPSGKVAARW
jgi:hypothetical protein